MKDRHQTAQNTKSGTSDQSSAKHQAARVQIPTESDFAAPIGGQKGSVLNPKIDSTSLEKAAQSLLDKETGDVVLEEVSTKTQDEKDITIERLYEMVRDLQSGNNPGSDIEGVWATAMINDQKMIEVDAKKWAFLVRSYKKDEAPTSIWYKDIRVFAEGTMDKVTETEGLNVDYLKGISKNKKAVNRFKGRR